MKSIKLKTLSLAMAVILTFALAACASKSEPAPAANTEPAPAPAQTPEVSSNTDVIAEAVDSYFANMPSDIYKIGDKEFVEKVKANENMFIMDIRMPDAYEKGHVKGAVNIPWGTAISENLDKLPSDKPIMVYCYTGQTAGQTVALLNMAGYTAKSVHLGWNLGISKVEGINDLIETTPNELVAGMPADTKSEIKAAIDKYYKGLDEVKGTTYANYKISEDDAKKLLDAKDDSIIFLSIRNAEDYAKGHIEGALNIPFANGMEKQFNTLPKDKKIIVYCYTGQTAGQTVAALRLLGYDAVSLNAGMGTPATGDAGWMNKGYPVVK